MSDLVGNPEDRFSRVAAHVVILTNDWCIIRFNVAFVCIHVESLALKLKHVYSNAVH